MANILKSGCKLRRLTPSSVSANKRRCSLLNPGDFIDYILRRHGIIKSYMFYLRTQCHNIAFVYMYVSNFDVCFGMIKQLKQTILGVSKILVSLDQTYFPGRNHNPANSLNVYFNCILHVTQKDCSSMNFS